MKIESRNKKKMYHDYIMRTGKGMNIQPMKASKHAQEIMAAKPYGGNYGRKMDAQQETAEPGTPAG